VACRHHLLDLLAQSGIGSSQESRALTWARFDIREKPLDLLPSFRCQGYLISHNTAPPSCLRSAELAAGPVYLYCAKSRRKLERRSGFPCWNEPLPTF
jgi:hypothetical protein